MAAILQKAGQQIADSVNNLKNIADSMKELNDHNKKMNMYDRGSNSERARSGADPSIPFKERVMAYYGQTMCMITGGNNAVGGHLVPDSAKFSEFSDLTIGYESDFAVANARNGLLLIDILEDGMDRSEIYFLMNPLNHRIQLFSRVKRFMEYDGMYLIYLNENAIPYRRALKDKFDTLKKIVAGNKGSLRTVNNQTPFETVAELSDKESQSDVNGNDSTENTDENEVKTQTQIQVNYDLDASWYCNSGHKNFDFEGICRRCGKSRSFITLNTTENRKKWAQKAVEYYGNSITKYLHLLPLVRQYYPQIGQRQNQDSQSSRGSSGGKRSKYRKVTKPTGN